MTHQVGSPKLDLGNQPALQCSRSLEEQCRVGTAHHNEAVCKPWRDVGAPQRSDVMRQKIRLTVMVLIVMVLAFPLAARAAVVGHFTRVTGNVDLLKGGRLPAQRVKTQEGVEPGDIIRTKARSKAQITFVDDSVLTLAPETRVAVADYLYDQARGERRAVVRVYRGLVHTLVTRLLQLQEPDFLMETHTAAIGVRGTEWYTLLMPNFTSIYLVQGLMDIRSILRTLPAVLPLQSLQFTQVPLGQQPRLPRPLTPDMLRLLRQLMDTGLQPGALLGMGAPPPEGGQLPLQLPVSPDQRMQLLMIPPQLPPARQAPSSR
jgi:hypothetical protein